MTLKTIISAGWNERFLMSLTSGTFSNLHTYLAVWTNTFGVWTNAFGAWTNIFGAWTNTFGEWTNTFWHLDEL